MIVVPCHIRLSTLWSVTVASCGSKTLLEARNSCLKWYSVEHQGMPATISETGHLVPYNCCLAVKQNSLEQRWLHKWLQMLYPGLVNILISFCEHADPRTRGAQCLHQEHTNHPVLFNSFSPHHKRLEPSSDCHHLSNFTPVNLEPVWWQPPQPAANSQSPLPMNPALCK